MASRARALRLLWALSWRSLFSHRGKSAIVGALLALGAVLFVVGTALTGSIERSMKRSIVSSLAGDVQIYSADAPDPLALFGGGGFGSEDIGELPDIARLRETILPLPEVEDVVPMGIVNATFTTQSDVDRALSALREAAREGDGERMRGLIPSVRQTLTSLQAQLRRRAQIRSDDDETDAALERLARVTTDAFWDDFEERPLEKLEVLDTEVAPLAPEGTLVYLRLLGTDLERFRGAFDRFRLVRGAFVPRGRRGLLVNERFLQQQGKLPVARELDAIHDEVVREGRSMSEPDLRQRVERNARKYGSLLAGLTAAESRELSRQLADIVGRDGGLGDQLQRFLHVRTDEELIARRRFFYRVIAPLVPLYAFDVGDVITLGAFSKSGYPRAVNVRVYGTFTFAGLERSELAGATNLIDLVTFRELYGLPTPEMREELERLKEEAGIRDIPRARAEEELFGGTGDGGGLVVEDVPEPGAAGAGPEASPSEPLDVVRRGPDRPFDPREVKRGLALNAAVILEEGASPDRAIERLTRLSEREGLGIQAVSWREASGLVGQFVVVIRVVLYIALLVIFAVALVIINNSLIISTLERVNEIGTLRALGAQRGFVRAMLLLETLFLTLLAGTVGVALGAGIVGVLHVVGIPATSDILIFLFGGPRLYPTVGVDDVLIALLVIVAVSMLAALYPARLATRVPPVVAMQRNE